MEALFRHHVEVAIRRLTASRTEGALRTVNLAVAFLDLVGFTGTIRRSQYRKSWPRRSPTSRRWPVE